MKISFPDHFPNLYVVELQPPSQELVVFLEMIVKNGESIIISNDLQLNIDPASINLFPFRINVYIYAVPPFRCFYCNNIMVCSTAEHTIIFSTMCACFLFSFDQA